MNLDEVMQEIAGRVDVIPNLNCFWYPADKITPDAFEVELPDEIDFDQTYNRGTDAMTLFANVLVGRHQDRSSVARLVPYVARRGERSIKSTLEPGPYESFGTLHIPRVEFAIFPIAGTDYLGAKFTLTITGPGS
jgi:hypothetical protein